MSKLIALDAGHGLYTSGKRCMKSIDPNETREWWLNQRIAGYVATFLAAYDCQTVRVDDITGNTDVSLSGRVSQANSLKADLYISVHHNAGINGGSGGGICIFIANSASATSKKLAQAVYDETVAKTGLKGNRAQQVLNTDFYVIKNTTMPAILGEFGFMDSTADVPVILTDKFAQQCAEGIAAAVVSVAGLIKLQGDIDADEGNTTVPSGDPSTWAVEACKKGVDAGIFKGDGNGNFRWGDNITREETAVVLDRCGVIPGEG